MATSGDFAPTEDSTMQSPRSQPMARTGLSKSQIRPTPFLRRSSELDSENVAPSNEANPSHLSASSECPLRRTTELPFPRPARSQSMSEGLGLRLLQSEDAIPLKLPTLPNQSPKSITGYQLAELLRTVGSGEQYDRILILDARFAYEFDGGHIIGAENVFLPKQQDAIKEKLADLRMGDRLCVVIHCEFSSHRGPRLFQMLRAFDRERNSYPNLSFPEMYLLHGGYKDFYGKFPEWCSRGYVPMHDQDYRKDYLWCSEATKLTRSRSSTKLRSMARSSSSDSSRLMSPFGNRDAGRNASGDDNLGASSSLSEPLPRRVIVSSGGLQESYFSIHSPTESQSAELTMDTSSDTEEEEDEFCPNSPAAAGRFRSRFGVAMGRGSAPPRSATLHNIPIRAAFNRSTSDLYHFPESEEETFTGPFTSRS